MADRASASKAYEKRNKKGYEFAAAVNSAQARKKTNTPLWQQNTKSKTTPAQENKNIYDVAGNTWGRSTSKGTAKPQQKAQTPGISYEAARQQAERQAEERRKKQEIADAVRSAQNPGKGGNNLFNSKMGTAFHNDLQMQQSRNRLFNPFVSAFEKNRDAEQNGKPATLSPFARKVNSDYNPKELQFVKQPELIGDVAKDAEPYVEKGEKSADNILNKKAPLIRDNGTHTINNYKYQVTTFIYENGEKQTETPGGALYKEQNARYLAQFMTDEEKTVYKYLLGKFGKDEAEKYITDTLNSARYAGNRLEDRAEIHDTQRRYISMGKNAPIISRVATPVLGVGGAIQGAGLAIKKAAGEVPDAKDYSNFVARQAMYEAQNAGHGRFYTTLNDAANGLFENLGGMAMSLIPVVGKVLEASFGGIQAMGDYYANAALNGEWNERGTGATGIVYGITGAAEWGLLGTELTKPLGKLATVGGQSALKEVVIGLSNKVLSGMGVGGAQQLVNTTAETIIKRENSAFRKAYAQLRHEGFDKDEAFSQAVKNVFVAPTVNAAVVGGIMGGVMGIPDTANNTLSFSRRGKSLMADGIGKRDIVEDGLTLNKDSAAYKNAEALKQRAEKHGWDSISNSQLGAQDFLNEAALFDTYDYSKRYTDALGIRLDEADLPEGVEGMSEGGTVVLNRNRTGLDISDTVRHEVGHEALRGGTPERSTYMEGLQSAVDYDRAYARMEQRLKERGQRYDKKIVDEELAAEFAINISPGLRDLPRLERAVKGSPRLYDKVYNNLRTLQAKLKARGGKQFYDENTGIRIGYEELNHMRQSLEAMLVRLPESTYNEGSAMYRAKKADDVNRYGVDIGAELDKMDIDPKNLSQSAGNTDEKIGTDTDTAGNQALTHVNVSIPIKTKAGEVPHDLLKSLGITSENELLPTSDLNISQKGGNVNTKFRTKSLSDAELDKMSGKAAQSGGDIDRYTYEALSKKPDMPVTELTEEMPLSEKGKFDRKGVVDRAIQNIRKHKNPKNTEQNSFIYIEDIGKDVLVGKAGLRHGLSHGADTNAKVIMNIGDILKHSIAINELRARDNTTGSYVLMGIGMDNEGNYYPTRIVVHNYEVESVEPLNVLYAIKAKKESRSGQPAEFTKKFGFSNNSLSDKAALFNTAGFTDNSAPLLHSSTNTDSQSPNGAGFSPMGVPLSKDHPKITISDFLNVVKQNFADTHGF